MYLEKLREIVTKHGNQRKLALASGIRPPRLSMMLSSKRPVGKEVWLQILTQAEGMSRLEATEQLATWQMEEAVQQLHPDRRRKFDETQPGYGLMTAGRIDKLTEQELDKELENMNKDHPAVLKGIPPDSLSLRDKRVILKAYHRV